MSQTEYLDVRTMHLPMAPPAAFAPIQRIGGTKGWYYANSLWRLRGMLDVLAGGPGLKRGRRDPEGIASGDHIDWWEVELFDPGRRLRLFSHMKVPGAAWLEFEVEPNGGGSLIRQTARFQPRGIIGRIYWYGLLPVHMIVFSGLIRAIGKAALREEPFRTGHGQEASRPGTASEEYDSGPG